MSQSKKKKSDHYLRKTWKVDPSRQQANPNKNYTPSHEREGFDESKVIKLKQYWSRAMDKFIHTMCRKCGSDSNTKYCRACQRQMSHKSKRRYPAGDGDFTGHAARYGGPSMPEEW